MERAEKIGLGVAAAGHLVLFGMLSLSLIWRDDSPKLGDPTVEVTIAGDPGTSELQSDSPLPISEPEPLEDLPSEELLEPEPEDISPPDTPSVQEELPDRSAEIKRQREIEQQRKREADARKKRERDAKAKRERDAKRKRDAEERRRRMAETQRQIANAANAANSGPPAKSAGQVKGEVNASIGREVLPFLRGCTPSGVDVKQIVTRVTLSLNRDGSLAGLSSVSQRGVNENNRLQAKPMENCVLGAIRRAAPFTSLDPAYYNVWKSHKTAFKGR